MLGGENGQVTRLKELRETLKKKKCNETWLTLDPNKNLHTLEYGLDMAITELFILLGIIMVLWL